MYFQENERKSSTERKSSKVHNCFASHDDTEEKEDLNQNLLPDDEEIDEMTDSDPVIDYKLERLINLLRLSRRTVVFTKSPFTKDKHYGTQCGIRCDLFCSNLEDLH